LRLNGRAELRRVRAGDPSYGVPGDPAPEIGRVRTGREQPTAYLGLHHLGHAAPQVAADHTGGIRRGEPGEQGAGRLLHPDPGIDTAHPVHEPDHAWRTGVGRWAQRAPGRLRDLDIQVDLSRARYHRFALDRVEGRSV